jgi:hypothetical protein
MQGRSRARYPSPATLPGSRGIGRDVTALQNLDSYIGAKYLDEIYDETFQPFRDERAKEGICVGTVDRDIGTAARVLEEAATKYLDEVTKLTWLREQPYINYARPYQAGTVSA